MDREARFDQYVYPDPNSGCFIWAGYTDSHGYGRFTVTGKKRVSGRQVGAHRFAWERVHGPIGRGLCVLHRCDTRCCVNPDHLFLGSVNDNNRDMARKGRGRGGSGLYGVRPQRGGRRFSAVIQVNKQTLRLGNFSTAGEAHQVALAAKRRHHGI